jgi:DNA-binding protein HU-beta
MMNRSELVNEVYGLLNEQGSGASSEHKFTKVFSEKVLNIVLDAITHGIKKDGAVQIVGFGTFSVTERDPRVGVNPRTGDKIQIGASKSVRFKAGAKLKESL